MRLRAAMGRRGLLGAGLLITLAIGASPYLFSSKHGAVASAEEPRSVSIIQLIANPERYDSREVRVVGFCRFEFEGNALYLHREDYEMALHEQAVQLSLPWPIPEKYRGLSDRYVIAEGRFDAQRKGRVRRFAGELGSIGRLDAWPSKAEMDAQLRLAPER